jgi:hypothetical protein
MLFALFKNPDSEKTDETTKGFIEACYKKFEGYQDLPFLVLTSLSQLNEDAVQAQKKALIESSMREMFEYHPMGKITIMKDETVICTFNLDKEEEKNIYINMFISILMSCIALKDALNTLPISCQGTGLTEQFILIHFEHVLKHYKIC